MQRETSNAQHSAFNSRNNNNNNKSRTNTNKLIKKGTQARIATLVELHLHLDFNGQPLDYLNTLIKEESHVSMRK